MAIIREILCASHKVKFESTNSLGDVNWL